MKKKIEFLKELKPGLIEYGNMGHEFRPFVQFTNADNYRTEIVNTDRNTHSLGNINNGAPIISAATQNNEIVQDQREIIVVENINHKWAVESFNRDVLDLDTLKVYFTDHAIKNALNAHLREHGPNVLNGVNYKKILN